MPISSEVLARAMASNLSLSETTVVDWGGLARGQGKRRGGMVMGGMGDAVGLQGRRYYTDLIGQLKDAEPENYHEATLLFGPADQKANLLRYSRLRANGCGHDESMDFLLKHF